jgi:hypothetical protein
MKRGTDWSLPAFVGLVSVVWLLSGLCGLVFMVDPARHALPGALLFSTACAFVIGAVMTILWILKWMRTPAGETVNLRLLFISLALVAGGFVLMVVAIANSQIQP